MSDRQKEQERRSRKLFIGGVSFSTNDEDFFKYFAKYGELEDCVLIREKDTGQSRGFGFVTYKDKAVSDHVATQQLYLDGRRLDPKPSISRYNMDQIHGERICSKDSAEHRNQTTKVFVGGLHDDTAEAEMSEHFGRFGEVLEVNIMYDRFTNAPRGFGFVTFKEPDVAHRVINYEQDHIVHGKKVDCKPATARKDAFKKFPDAPVAPSAPSRVDNKPTSREERWRKYHGQESRDSHSDPYHRSHSHGHHGGHSSHHYPSSSHSYHRGHSSDIPPHHATHSSYGRHPSSYPPPNTHHAHHPSSYPPPHGSYPPPHPSYPPPATSSTAPIAASTTTPHSSYAHHPSYQYSAPSSHYPARTDPPKSATTGSTSSASTTTVPPPYDYSRYDPYAYTRQDPRYPQHHYPPPPATTTTSAATSTPASQTNPTAVSTTGTTATSTSIPQPTSTAATSTTTATAPSVYDYSQYQYPSYYQDQTAAATSAATSATTATSATSAVAAPRYDYYSQYGRRGTPSSSSSTAAATTVAAPTQASGSKSVQTVPKQQTAAIPSGYGASRGSVATNSAQANRYSAY